MAKYITPDFDVTVYEIEEEITNSFNNGESGWDDEPSKMIDWD
jgi:hypothetical protein